MSKIAIMTDSNCGIMPSEESSYGIHILPMQVIINGETHFEGVDLQPDEFYKMQEAGSAASSFALFERM